MKTNTNTELREQLIKGFENVDFESTAIANFVDARILPLIDQYVHQKTIEAALEELKTLPSDTLVYGRAQPLTVSFRLAELQASLNTEGEKQ